MAWLQIKMCMRNMIIIDIVVFVPIKGNNKYKSSNISSQNNNNINISMSTCIMNITNIISFSVIFISCIVIGNDNNSNTIILSSITISNNRINNSCMSKYRYSGNKVIPVRDLESATVRTLFQHTDLITYFKINLDR